jgi:hypothetical protein
MWCITSPVNLETPTFRSKLAAPSQRMRPSSFWRPKRQKRTWWRRRGLFPTSCSKARSCGRRHATKCVLIGAEEYGRLNTTLPASSRPLRRVIRSASTHPAAHIAARSSPRVPKIATLIGSAGMPSAVYVRRGSALSKGSFAWQRHTAGRTPYAIPAYAGRRRASSAAVLAARRIMDVATFSSRRRVT